MSPHSYASLEEVATGIRDALPLRAGERYSLDCARILEQTLPNAGFKYKIVEVDDLDECAAFTIPEKGLVVIREDIYDMLYNGHVFGRSTVVHEMGHIVLKHAVTLHRGAKLGQHRFCEDSEWQAKAITAALMMPVEACVEAGTPEELARMCGTSVQSATFRLDNLRKYGKISGQRRLFW
ncbi:ImmA/IrrE family metallo-endopeptidase [Azotobacter chroococcum]|nr:ImmA/IrrE family metallo-endopeptidase [Azotobacter chroococcum]